MNFYFTQKGDFSKATSYLERLKSVVGRISVLDKYGRAGVSALSSATPKESGLAASSWYYEIERGKGFVRIIFGNSDVENGFPVAIMLQYGHGTGTGGWVEGRDYINPAIQPIFDKIAADAWREVTKL